MRNRYLAAFQENFNVLGLATTVAASAALLNPLPLLIGLVVEAAYLIFFVDTAWYAERLSRRNDVEVLARREELKAKTLPLLRSQLQNRFTRLEESRREIDEQAVSDAIWMREVLRKLDFLLEKFLQFGLKEEQFRAYLREAREEVESGFKRGERLRRDDRAPEEVPSRYVSDGAWVNQTVTVLQSAYDVDIADLQSQLEVETDESTKAILVKRIEVLERRREFVSKIGKIVANLNHQLSLVEDTFGLIKEELLARPPEQVLADIEDVVSQTNVMTQVLEELVPYERMLATIGK